MNGIAIPLRDTGPDLHEILAMLGSEASRSTWSIRNVECFGAGAEELHRASDERLHIQGERLLTLCKDTQVVDGDFVARLRDDDKPWVQVRVVDCSWIDVLTDHAAVLRKLRVRFGVATFEVPEAFELLEFFGSEPIQESDGFAMYEVRDDAGTTLRFSFDVLARSVQTHLLVGGATVDVVSHDNAERLRINGQTRELIVAFDRGEVHAELRVTLAPRVHCEWSTLTSWCVLKKALRVLPDA